MHETNSEIHLFIVWEKARNRQSEILGDIKKKFQVLDILEVSWSKRNFASNLTRFYGLKLPSRSSKERHCGTGPFLLVVVRDFDPNYEDRATSTGITRVNVATFDCKELSRSWTGGGHRVHATNTPEETQHDLALLLGQRSKHYLDGSIGPWDGKISSLNQDLVGADFWESLDEIFYVLNNTINYVVMRNFEGLPSQHVSDVHGDIDLLTDDYADLCFITNGKRVLRKSYRVYHTVAVGENTVYFDFRYVGDGYYDKRWQRNMIENRVYKNDEIYVQNDENYFYSLLYHAAVHKQKIVDDYIARILQISENFREDLTVENLRDSDWLSEFLTSFLVERSYSFSDPLDLSVYYNVDIVGRDCISKRRLVYQICSFPVCQLKRVVKFLIRWDSRV